MSHLIQPIEIPTAPLALYCMTQQGGRATIGLATNDIIPFPIPPADITNPASPRGVDVFDFGATEISFGVGCGDEVTLSISTSGEPTDPGFPTYTIDIESYVNGALQATDVFSDSTPTGNIVISLSDVACGNVVTLVISGTAECYATITIDFIT